MGSWNGTCGISNLPIRSGEKIALFVIKRNRNAETNSGGFCYPHEQYYPLTIPILGEYNDYGGIENISSNEKLIFDHLSSLDLTVDEKEKDRQRLDGKPKNLEELLNDYIERGVYKGIGTMMVHEEIYNEIINFDNQLKTKYVFGAREFTKLFTDKMQEINAIEDEKERVRTKMYFSHIGLMDLRDNYFVRILDDYNGNWRTYKELFEEFVDNNLIDGIIDLRLMEVGLSNLRKFWTIQSGAGSQDDEVELHEIISLKVLGKSIEQKIYRSFDDLSEEQYEAITANSSEEEYVAQKKIEATLQIKKVMDSFILKGE